MSENRASSGWSAVTTVFTNPTATFNRLAERPVIMPAYLIASVVGTVMAAALVSKGLTEAMAPGAPPAVAQAANIGGIIGGAASPWLAGLILSGVAALFGTFAGGGVPFRSYFSIIGYARLPLMVAGVIQSVLALASGAVKGMPNMDISLAALLPHSASPIIRGFLTTINPFDLWYLALLGLGFAALHRARPAKAAPLVITVYVIGLGISMFAAFTAAGL